MTTSDTMTALGSPNAADTVSAPKSIVVRHRALVMAHGVRLPLLTWEPVGPVVATMIGLHASAISASPLLRPRRRSPSAAIASTPTTNAASAILTAEGVGTAGGGWCAT